MATSSTPIVRLLVMLCVVPVFCSCHRSQPCTLGYDQSPELRGFRLGMPVADIQSRFAGFPTPAVDDLGVSSVVISGKAVDPLRLYDRGAITNVNPEKYPELNQLKYAELKLLDGKVIEITVYYANDLNWKSVDEFAEKTGEALKLNGTWTKVGNDGSSSMRNLMCGEIRNGFHVNAGMNRPPLTGEYANYPYVQVQDFWRAQIELYQRRKDRDDKRKREEQEKRDSFKP